jgi:hypothetical protein
MQRNLPPDAGRNCVGGVRGCGGEGYLAGARRGGEAWTHRSHEAAKPHHGQAAVRAQLLAQAQAWGTQARQGATTTRQIC